VLRKQKQEIIDEIREQIQGSPLIIFSTFTGLNVEKITQLRRLLREVNSSYRVVKNTLMKKAVKGTDLEAVERFLVGPSAVIFAKGEPSKPCKIIKEFKKENEQLEIKGGVFTGKVLSKKEIEELADLPSREVLIAKLLLLFRSPQQRLVNVLIGVPQKLVQVLEAIKKKKEA